MSRLKTREFFIFFTIITCFLVGSCKVAKNLSPKDELEQRNAQFLIKQIKKAEFNSEWLSAKASVDVLMNGSKQSFKANLRLKKDSVIWLSLTPALGIEVMRIELTNDSLKYIDKLQKKFFMGTFEEINTHFDTDFNFDLFQNYFFGNPVEMDPDNKYMSTVDGMRYLLSTKAKPKIRRAIGLKKDDLRKVSPDSTLNFHIQKKRYDKVKERGGDDDLLIVRYWVEPGTYKVSSLLVNDLKRSGALEINFDNFVEEEGGLFPLNAKLFLAIPGRNIDVSMEYRKPKINEPQSFPFKIPDKYEQIYY